MTDAHFIPDELATRTARLINEAEDMRAQAVDDLKTIYGDLREELKALGWLGQNISKEVAAFKAAISEMRLDEEQKAKREEKGDRIDDYVALLSRSRAGARARTREGNAYAEAKLVETVAAGVQTEMGRKALITAVDIMIAREEAEESRANVEEEAVDESAAVSDDPASRTSEESERQRASMVGFADDCRTGGKEQSAAAAAPVGDAAAHAHGIPANSSSTESVSPNGEPSSSGANAGGGYVESSAERARNAATNVANAAESVTAGETAANSTAKPKYVLRPHCLNPGEACGGYSDKHCHACTVAMRKREQAEEVA